MSEKTDIRAVLRRAAEILERDAFCFGQYAAKARSEFRIDHVKVDEAKASQRVALDMAKELRQTLAALLDTKEER